MNSRSTKLWYDVGCSPSQERQQMYQFGNLRVNKTLKGLQERLANEILLGHNPISCIDSKQETLCRQGARILSLIFKGTYFAFPPCLQAILMPWILVPRFRESPCRWFLLLAPGVKKRQKLNSIHGTCRICLVGWLEKNFQQK